MYSTQCHNVSTWCTTGCCSSAPLWSGYSTPATGVRTTNTELFSGYDLRQRIAYRIGQVECLKSLLSEGNTQYGLGALHRGNYTTDITRFSLRQRIAFLMGQVQCLKIHLSLEGNRTNTSDNHHRVEQDSGHSQEPGQAQVCMHVHPFVS